MVELNDRQQQEMEALEVNGIMSDEWQGGFVLLVLDAGHIT